MRLFITINGEIEMNEKIINIWLCDFEKFDGEVPIDVKSLGKRSMDGFEVYFRKSNTSSIRALPQESEIYLRRVKDGTVFKMSRKEINRFSDYIESITVRIPGIGDLGDKIKCQ